MLVSQKPLDARQHNFRRMPSRALTEFSGGICEEGAEDSITGSAGGSRTGSGLETQTCMVDLRPEVPIAIYLLPLSLDK